MRQPPALQRFGLFATAAAILLPIGILVILGVAGLLEGMGDIAGGTVLRKIALAGSVGWVIDLIILLLVLAVGALFRPDDLDEPQ